MVYYHQDSSVKSTQMYYFKTYKKYKLKITKQSIKLIYQKKDIASESHFNLQLPSHSLNLLEKSRLRMSYKYPIISISSPLNTLKKNIGHQ